MLYQPPMVGLYQNTQHEARLPIVKILLEKRVEDEKQISTGNIRRSRWWIGPLRSEPPPWSRHPAKFIGYKSCENTDIIWDHKTLRAWGFHGKSLSCLVSSS